MVLQFIGFMTGWQNAGQYDQVVFAVVCALLVTFATFLPSFLFVFLGAPYVERLQENKKLSGALIFVTAAVVGVILSLSIIFGSTVIFMPDSVNAFGVVLAAAAFISLYFLKADVLLVVLSGGLFGLAKYLLFG
ncbi:MAG: chromate transporter [Blastocatellia bacterium]